jgi:hypothetical protein
MRFASLLRTSLLTAAAPLWVSSAWAGPLDAYQDLHRIIVVSLPHGSSAEKITNILAPRRTEIEERDLKIIDVSEGQHRITNALRPAPEQINAIRKQLDLKAGETQATFILIGKDGGEKARSLGTLNLEKWFALIDGMPMRRAEMKAQQNNNGRIKD